MIQLVTKKDAEASNEEMVKWVREILKTDKGADVYNLLLMLRNILEGKTP